MRKRRPGVTKRISESITTCSIGPMRMKFTIYVMMEGNCVICGRKPGIRMDTHRHMKSMVVVAVPAVNTKSGVFINIMKKQTVIGIKS